MIGYKNTISGGSSIMQPIRIPENTRNVILLMNLIYEKQKYFQGNLGYACLFEGNIKKFLFHSHLVSENERCH